MSVATIDLSNHGYEVPAELKHHGAAVTADLDTRGCQDPAARILVAARLSRVVKGRETVSIERQDRQAEDYEAADPGRVIVATAPDAGISGSVSPFKRPKLGKYLTDPELIPTWDELVASALDRIGRNARDLATLRAWAEDHGKRITVLSPRLTWPPAPDDFASGLIWDVLARLAEIELRLTTKRYADTRAYLRANESLIGRPCWGFKVIGHKAAKTLEPDPARVDYLTGMVDRALAGVSQEDIAAWMDREAAEHEAARPWGKGRWHPKSVGKILRNSALCGLRKENGVIVLRHAGVITADKFARLQTVLDGNPKRRGPQRNPAAELTDVLYCAVCGGVMHARRTPGRRHKDGTPAPVWTGYRCDHTRRALDDGTVTLDRNSTCSNMIAARDIEPWVDDVMTRLHGDLEVIERRLVPADNHGVRIAEIDAELRALDFDAPEYAERHDDLMAERAALKAAGATPAHYEDRHTGETVAARWVRLSPADKRDYLRRSGTKIFAASAADAPWTLDVAAPNVLTVA